MEILFERFKERQTLYFDAMKQLDFQMFYAAAYCLFNCFYMFTGFEIIQYTSIAKP